MKKVLFMIDTLGGGGAEKTLLNLVKLIDKSKFDITVVAIHDYGIYSDEIKKNVKYKFIFKHCDKQGIKRKILGVVSILGDYVIKILPANVVYKILVKGKYDTVVAFLEGKSTKILSGAKENQFSIAWVHTNFLVNPWSERAYRSRREEEIAYKKFNKVICVSQDASESLKEKYNIDSVVLYNPLDVDEIKKKALEYKPNLDKKKVNFLSVGSLIPVKGYDRLIKVVTDTIKECDNFKITILGEGRLHKELEKEIYCNNLQEYIELKGFVSNPYPYMKECDYFLSTSYTEGYSGVICEALVLDKNIIAPDISSMREILTDKKRVVLYENNFNGLKKAVQSAILEGTHSSLKDVCENNFDVEERIKRIEAIIENC